MAYEVPNPYVATTHPYPTRFHGGIWTRPTFGMPYMRSVQSVFKPSDFNDGNPALRGLGDVNAANGVFGTEQKGGGVFGPSLYGLGLGTLGADYSTTFQPMIDDPNAVVAFKGPTAPQLRGQGSGESGDSRVSELQGYLNRVLATAGLTSLTQDGKLGAKGCGAIAWYRGPGRSLASASTAAAIDANLGAMGTIYSAVCATKGATAPGGGGSTTTVVKAPPVYAAPPVVVAPPPAPPVEPAKASMMGAGTWAMIGGGVLAVGLAVVGKKKGWF